MWPDLRSDAKWIRQFDFRVERVEPGEAIDLEEGALLGLHINILAVGLML